MPETIVVGLDGANWNLLAPWLKTGDLPNISMLRDSGESADMQSELPPVTCPNWRCYSTGKNPGKLGVYWWEKIDTQNSRLSTPNSRSFKSANYWDYLNDEGLTAGIVNLPMTYPPFELDGYMIAGGPGSEQEQYTVPEQLGQELDEDGYQIHPKSSITSATDFQAAETVIDLIDTRLSTFLDLLEERPVDIAHCTVFYINVLQHYFWRDSPTHRAWQIIDEYIGEIRERYPDATLVLMSDHGCTEIDTVFHANNWLEEEGFLQTTVDATSLFESLGINERRIENITERFGISDLVTTVTPDFIRHWVPHDDGGAIRERKLDRVDWDKTQAIASGQGLVYTADDQTETRMEIIDRLEDLTSSISGKQIARDVFRREDIYEGPYIDDAPEIVFEQTPGVHTSGAIGDSPVFEDADHWRAENVRTGLFLADGPDVTGSISRSIGITDVAPTILHSVDCAVPEDMDGDPIRLFNRSPKPTTNPIVPEFVDDTAATEARSRLEDLGYLE